MALPYILASLSFLLVLPLILASFLSAKSKNSSVWKLPPGPTKLPIIGNLHLLLGKNVLHRCLWSLSKKHGPLMFLKLGQVSTVVVSSAELAKEILKNHDLDCCSRPHLTASAKLSYGCSDVGFAAYGDQWRELLKICITELFSNRKVMSFKSIREEEVERLMKKISSNHAGHSLPLNLSEALFSLSSSIICRSAFGRGYCDGGTQFHAILKETQALLAGSCFFMADYFPMLGWMDMLTGARSRLENNFFQLDRFYQQLIDEHLHAMKQSFAQGGDTLHALLRMQKDTGYLSENHIKGLLMNIFIAGTDTSSSAIEWAMAELIRHPEMMRKAQNEVRRYVGRKRMVEEGDLHQLHYMKAVIKEAMRLYPPAPLLLPRETMRYFKLNGYDIPPKTTIFVNIWAIGRDPSSWEKPDEFYPERFVSSSDELKDHSDFRIIPFGEGRRICPGKNLGTLSVELVLANLLYCFDWDLPVGMTKEDISMDEAPGITVHRRHALQLMPTKYYGMDT